jgi:hypothetical protein
MAATTFPGKISTLDALWALYQSQSKLVRDAFRMRVLAEKTAKKDVEVNHPYEQQLSEDVRNSVSMMAISIKKSAEEVRQAALNNTHVGRRAEDFLNEFYI